MEKNEIKTWNFNKKHTKNNEIGEKKATVREAMGMLRKQFNSNDDRQVVPLGHGDPPYSNAFVLPLSP